jgi:Protein of unknown function (DUF3168)
MAEETALADHWVREQLTGSSVVTGYVGTGIYMGQAPDEAEYPFIVYNNQSAEDLRVVGHQRVWTDTVYNVRAIANTADFDVLSPIALAIEQALHDIGTTVVLDEDGEEIGVMYESYKQRPFRMFEMVEGYPFAHLGGVYRIKVIGS